MRIAEVREMIKKSLEDDSLVEAMFGIMREHYPDEVREELDKMGVDGIKRSLGERWVAYWDFPKVVYKSLGIVVSRYNCTRGRVGRFFPMFCLVTTVDTDEVVEFWFGIYNENNEVFHYVDEPRDSRTLEALKIGSLSRDDKIERYIGIFELDEIRDICRRTDYFGLENSRDDGLRDNVISYLYEDYAYTEGAKRAFERLARKKGIEI